MRKLCCMVVVLGVVAVMTAPASAQDTSAIIFAGNIWASSEANAKFPEAGSRSQCWDAKHGVSYGEIDWSLRGNYAVDWCSAGYQWRLANQSDLTPDYYERLAHWGYGYGRDFYRFTRGVVRYDEDTFVVLGTAMGRTNNLNGAMVPIMSQLEYRPDWYAETDPGMPTDNQWAWYGQDVNAQIQLAQAPMGHLTTIYQWGPRLKVPAPGATFVDWCFTGGGLTGKLQLAETTVITKEWSWLNDPNNPLLPYYSFDVDPNMKQVDNEWGVRQGDYAWEIGDSDANVNVLVFTDANATFVTDGVVAGNRCQVFSGTGVNVGAYNVDVVDSETQLTLAADAGNSLGLGDVVYRVTPWSAPSARGDVYVGPGGSGSAGSSATILDLEVFYGASENLIYTCQFQGRIYKMTGVKDLGYRRMENQPSHLNVGSGERVTNDAAHVPTYTPGTNLVGPGGEDNAKPLLGDKPSDYPSSPTSGSGPNPQGPYGVGITATEMFADNTGTRRYVGLAVDGGGRVYAVSQRVMENGAELAPIGGGSTLVDVWNIDPVVPSGFSLSDPNASFDGNSLGDVILISGGTNVNVGQYTVASVYDAQKVELSADPGVGGLFDVVYIMYEAGQNPKPSTTKTQGSSFDVDRTVLLASDVDGVLANGGGAGPFTLTDTSGQDFVTAGVTDSDRVAVVGGDPGGNVGTYSIATGGVTVTVLTLESGPGKPDPGAGTPILYEVFKPTQAVLEGDSDADVATTVLTDANATFVTNANIDPLGGDKLAIISGSTVNVGVYTIANGGVTETTLTITAGDMGNSGVAGDVVYEVVDGKAGFALTDMAADFVAASVAYGDTVKMAYDGDPNLPNWGTGPYTVRGISTTQLDLSSDAGDSYGLLIQDIYDVFAPGSANWQSEALLDIFEADGTLVTVDLNTLLRPDGTTMGASITSGGLVSGFMVGGDVEIAPNLVYEVTPDPEVTRLWICGVTDPDAGDGLDLLVVDVTVDGDGAVADVSYLGAIDTGNLVGGDWYTGDFNISGFQPFSMWVTYNDLEFDAAGNAVVVGGRAGNDNRYMAMAAADVLLAVGVMIQEAGLSEDAVVGAGARYLDMNYFGLGSDFGLAFDNSAEGPPGDELPLRNYGAGPAAPAPELLSSKPVHGTTFAKIKNNCIWLTFDVAPVLTGGNELLVRTIGTTMGPNLGGSFTCSIDLAFDVSGKTLKAKENAVQLVNTTWYRFEPNQLVCQPFAVDLCTLYGNANNDNLTFSSDYPAVKAMIPTFMTDIREDINGDGLVFSSDYPFIKSFIPTFKPPKPPG